MKALFIGNGQIATLALRSVIDHCSPENVRVITKKEGKGHRAIPELAQKSGVDYDFFDKRNEHIEDLVNKTESDIILVVSFGEIFKKSLLEEHHGTFFNMHFSSLPRWRGAAPVQRAIEAGDTKFGLTLQQIAPTIDAGKIVSQEAFSLPNQTSSQVFKVLSEASGPMVTSFLEDYEAGTIQLKEQDPEKITHAPKITRNDGNISLSSSAKEVWHKYLAYDIWPGISIETNKGTMKIREMSESKITEEDLELKLPDGSLWIQKAQLPGKKTISAKDLRNGHPDFRFK